MGVQNQDYRALASALGLYSRHNELDIANDDDETIMASSSTAYKTFNLANDIYSVSIQDEIYKFDVDTHKRILKDAPWSKE